MEIVKIEDIKENLTDSLSTIKVSSGINKYMEQVNFRCDISVKEAGFELIKCETNPGVEKNTCYDTEMRIKTEVKDKVDTQENGINYEHRRSVETRDYKADSEQIVGGQEDIIDISVNKVGSVKCEINLKEEETTGYDTEMRFKTEIKDEVGVGHGVDYEPLISIRNGDYKIEPDQECMEHTTTDTRCILLKKLGFDHRQYDSNMESTKHEEIVGKDDTDGIEVCTEKQNAIHQCEPNNCVFEYDTGGVGKYKLKIKDDLIRHCKYKNNINQHKSLLPDKTNLQTYVKVTQEGNAKRLKCQYCNYITNHRSCLRIHLVVKHTENDRLYQCSSCEYKTGYKLYLLDHYKWKHDNAPKIFHCKECDFKTKGKQNLLRHHRIKHDDTAEVLLCKLCDFKTKDKFYLLQHHKLKHDTAEFFQCELCDFKTKAKSNLSRHHRFLHDDSAEVSFCKLCDFKTKYKNGLLQHHRLKHDVAEFFHCELCNFKTKHKSYLSRHCKLKHGDASGIFHCELCDFETKYRCNFLEHRRLKHLDATESFHCALCDFETKYKYSLLKHHRSMHNDAAEIYRCDQCDYKTKKKNNFLKHHRLSHD